MLALLARWFRFQPSEMNALEVGDLLKWVELAKAQISASAEAR